MPYPAPQEHPASEEVASDIFYYINSFRSKLIEKASRQTPAEGPDFRLIPRQNVHPGRYFLELIIGLLRTKNRGSPTVSLDLWHTAH